MKLTYDHKYNIAYLKINDKVQEVETISLSNEVNIDISPDGRIYGIELLNANEQLHLDIDNQFIFEDVSNGKTVSFALKS